MPFFNSDTNFSLPSWKALAFIIPLFLQLHLLHPFYVKNYWKVSKSCRLILCPIGAALVLTIPRKYPFLPRETSVGYNFFFGMMCFHTAMKFVELGIAQEPYFFVGLPIEKTKGSLETISHSDEDLEKENSSHELFKQSFAKRKEWRRHQVEQEGFSQRIASTFRELFNMRGVGHSWGPDSLSRIPPPLAYPTSPHWKRTWLTKTVLLCINFHILYATGTKLVIMYSFDRYGISSSAKNYPLPLRHPSSPPLLPSSLFLPTFIPEWSVYSNEPWFQWISSMCSSMAVGLASYAGMALSYHLLSLVAFIYSQFISYTSDEIPFDPRLWPPLFDLFPDLLKNCSTLGDFWSKGWHGLFRRVFQVLGMDLSRNVVRGLKIKNQSLERSVGIILVFIWTAVLHEWALRQATSHSQSQSQLPSIFCSPTMIFFITEAVLVLLQSFAATNLPLNNQLLRILGLSWVSNVNLMGGSVLVEGWVDRGAISRGAHPQTWSAWRFAIPFGTTLPEGVLTNS